MIPNLRAVTTFTSRHVAQKSTNMSEMFEKVGADRDNRWGTSTISSFLRETFLGETYEETAKFDLHHVFGHWQTYFRRPFFQYMSDSDFSSFSQKLFERREQLRNKYSEKERPTFDEIQEHAAIRDCTEGFDSETLRQKPLTEKDCQMLKKYFKSWYSRFEAQVKKSIENVPGDGSCMYYAVVLGLARHIVDDPDENGSVLQKWNELTGGSKKKADFVALVNNPWEEGLVFWKQCGFALRRALRQALINKMLSLRNQTESEMVSFFLYGDYIEYLQTDFNALDTTNFFKSYEIPLTQEERKRYKGASLLKITFSETKPTIESVRKRYNELKKDHQKFNLLVEYEDNYYYLEEDKLEHLASLSEGSKKSLKVIFDDYKKNPSTSDLRTEVQEHLADLIGRECPLSDRQKRRLFLERCNSFDASLSSSRGFSFR